MRRLTDHVLCSLPFEEEWFRDRGCNATFVGHPFFDELRQQALDEAFLETHRRREGPLVTILPGSRTQEVLHNLPCFLKAAARVREAVPAARFAVAAFKPQHARMAAEMTARTGQWEAQMEIHSGRTPELMHLATCCMACSGSISLELLYHLKPTVIHYRIGSLAYAVQKRFRKVKYITLVNLLSTAELYPADLSPYDPAQSDAEKVLFPEYLTCEDKSAAVAGHVVQWLTDPAALARQVAALDALKVQVAHGGALVPSGTLCCTLLRKTPRPGDCKRSGVGLVCWSARVSTTIARVWPINRPKEENETDVDGIDRAGRMAGVGRCGNFAGET